MEINEKLRLNFNAEKVLGWIVGLMALSWSAFSYIQDQNEKDLRQSQQIEQLQKEFLKFQESTDKKLDKIIQNQENDHTFILKHEYEKK